MPSELHESIIKSAVKHLQTQHGCNPILTGPCMKRAGVVSGERPDILAFGFRGASIVAEVKVTLADAEVDIKKPWRVAPWTGMGQARILVVPNLMVESYYVGIDGHPRWNWGLWYALEDGAIQEVVQPPILRRRWNVQGERALLCAYVRYLETYSGRTADESRPSASNRLPERYHADILALVAKGKIETRYAIKFFPELVHNAGNKEKAKRILNRAALAGEIPGVMATEKGGITTLEPVTSCVDTGVTH